MVFQNAAFAKGGDKGSVVWIGAGAGSSASQVPSADIPADLALYGQVGYDKKLIGPFFGTIGAAIFNQSGELDYGYLNPEDGIQYNAENIDYVASGTEYFLGLKIRIIDTKYLRFFIGGGGLAGSAAYKNDARLSTEVTALGFTYESEQRSIKHFGYYGDGGFDLMFGAYGLRLAGRFSEVETERINVIGKKHYRYRDSFGFIAFIQEL
jgi:hypothetical protein